MHQSIERYHKYREAEPSKELLEELNPTYMARMMARELVGEYLQSCLPLLQDWKRVICEKPLFKNLANDIQLMAKVDTVLFIDEQTTLADGLTIESGVWCEEYKSRDQQMPREKFMVRWTLDLQASCQILTARENYENVQGVLVTVLEKPRRTIPMRTCKTCHGKWDFYLWLANSQGTWNCPMCSASQKLDPPKNEGQQPPTSFRILIQRTEEQLQMAEKEILRRARIMQEIEKGKQEPSITFESCCDPIFGACEFLEPHSQLVDPKELGWMEQDTKRYMLEGE
jgi:hypothetical protein